MAFTLWSQDIFTKGELSPYMYARATVNEYYNGLKTAQNVLTYPTGAAGKRFGTLYQATIDATLTYQEIYFQTFQYLNECVYQLVFIPLSVYVFLEGIEIFRINTSLTASQVYNLSTTVLGAAFRGSGVGFPPFDITRGASIGHTIASFTSTTFTTSAGTFLAGTVLPTIFSVTGGTIMQTTPQITAGIVYFTASTSTTVSALFTTSYDAKQYLINNSWTTNQITIQSLGTGTTTATPQNAWSIANTRFRDLPFYDFNGATTSYDALTFTPSATSGAAVTITVSSAYAPLTTAYVGGAFIGGGGSARITAVASTTSFTVAVQTPFAGTSAILGSLAVLAEPAWSDARGWPQVCSSYQSRALFANTSSLPNGFWASVINDYSDFGDLTTDDDDAISWYPTSDNMNYINFIVPYRSITVHTNTGIYSSPLSDIVAITPTNFTLQLQDSTPADVLQPQAVDNQILVLSGNDAHQMIWDGINNAYTSTIVSVINEQLIRTPLDETAFQNLHRAGSRFVFIINQNGSMATFQTLISQGVAGFTPQIMEQSYGNAYFRQVASSSDGRCWFLNERQVATADMPVTITAFTPYVPGPPIVESTLTFGTPVFAESIPYAITFTTTGTLPASTPPLAINTYYWAFPTSGSSANIYASQADAIAGVNAFRFTSTGTSSDAIVWPLSTIFTLEELSDTVFLDCAVQYSGTPTDTITTGVLYNAQDVKMIGDGFGFVSPAEVNVNNEVVFTAHGVTTDVSNAFIGFPINTVMEPMALSISTGSSAKQTSLTRPTHVRWARFMFNNTIGGTINGVPIALEPFDKANIGNPPQPARGIFEMSIMKGWDDFNNPTYTIEHSEPFNIQLLGVFYSVDN
jgi:hypothetical protein